MPKTNSSKKSECARLFERIWKERTDPIEIEKRKIKENREEYIKYNQEDIGL